MTTRRRGHTLAVLDGELHAVGGEDKRSEGPDVEKYDPRADSWSAVPGMSLPESRRFFASAVLL